MGVPATPGRNTRVEALGLPWVRAVRDATRARVFPPELRKVEVVGTKLKDNAGIYGAALLARDARRK